MRESSGWGPGPSRDPESTGEGRETPARVDCGVPSGMGLPLCLGLGLRGPVGPAALVTLPTHPLTVRFWSRCCPGALPGTGPRRVRARGGEAGGGEAARAPGGPEGLEMILREGMGWSGLEQEVRAGCLGRGRRSEI